MKKELKQLQKAIAYQKKQQQAMIDSHLGLLNAKIETLLQSGQCKPVITALEQIKPMLPVAPLCDLRELGNMLEQL